MAWRDRTPYRPTRNSQDHRDSHGGRVLARCIAELPERNRDLILLRNYAEQSWEEVAAETGRASANAARVASGP